MTMVYTQWDEAKEAFAEAEEAAIRDWTCFCTCGCRAAEVEPVNRVGFVFPGLCKRCTKRGLPKHNSASAATFWNDMETEAEAYAAANPHLVVPDPAPTPVEAPKPRAPGFLHTVAAAFVEGLHSGYRRGLERGQGDG